MLRKCILSLLSLFFLLNLTAQPTISSFSPASGPVGTSITITGTNFSSTAANNVVFFGVVKASVTGATANSLTVTVPTGATFQPISVTNNNLTAYSSHPFIVTFNGAAPQFTTQSFQYSAYIDSVNSTTETTKYCIGDIDGDGRIDMVTVDKLNNVLSVYRNTITGGIITFAPRVDFPTSQSPRAVTVGDIDGDGQLDVVVSNLSANTVSVFKNTSASGVISFAPKMDFTTATQPSGISITDLDKDGKPDIVVNSITLNGGVSILRNTSNSGTISFALKVDLPLSGGSIENIKTADIDGDGNPDILVPNFGTGYITILRNTSFPGTISFAPKVEIGTSGYPDQLEIGDLNNDGKPDMSVSYYLTGDIVTVCRNTSTPGTISFDNVTNYQIGNFTDGIAINDLDGDGKPDMAVSTGSDSVSLFKNISSPGGIITFSSIARFACPWNTPVLTGDFDADGRPDLTFKSGLFRVTVWKNRTASPQIFSFTPTSGNVGTTITIHGVNFSGVNAVIFGGVPASSFTVQDANTITAVVDAGATGDLVIKNPNDSARISGFVFTAPPLLTSFSPASAATGTTVTISGSYMNDATAVSFGGVPATSFSVINQHTITAVVGAGASGDISVTTQYGTTSITGFSYIPIPTITSFSPTSGGNGTSILINGTNFSGATSISFGGISATSFTVVSSILINAIVGPGASGAVSVTTPFGTATVNGFVYVPPPVISSFTPTSGQTGSVITITGTNLGTVTGVQFGGIAASSVTVVNSTTVTAVVGTGAAGNVTVTSSYGSSSLPGFTYLSIPIITSFSPVSGPIGSIVTIVGSYFSDATQVYFGGLEAASFSIVSDDTIVAVAGIGYSGQFTIINPIGSGFSSTGFNFVYPAPTISSFTRASGATGAQINITGTNFLPGLTLVGFGTSSATSVTVNSSTSITATVGTGSSGDVSVSTQGGVATMPGFTYIPPPPAITQVIPLNAIEGMAVIINGGDFTGASAVSFGGTAAASFVVNSQYQITAIVGAGSSGDVSVTTANGTGTYSGFVFAPVVITSFSPTSGSQGSVINITGSGFVNVSSVKFGDVPASSVVVNSPISITATVGSGSSGVVSVTTQGLFGYKEGFTFITSSTSISSVTPSIGGPGTTVTINGYGFTGTTAVSFGGTAVSSFVVNSTSSITATLANGSPGTVSVVSPSGTATFDGFIYTGVPVISSFAPEAAMAGTFITISGSNFNLDPSGNTVYFGGIKANVISATTNSLIVLVPTGAPYSYITVTSNGQTGYSQKKFKSTFLATAPLNTSSFDVRIDSIMGLAANHVNTADFDIDGKTDVVVCDPANIAIFKNSSTPGTISFLPRSPIINSSRTPLNSVTGDLDGDGKLDLITGNGRDGQNVSVYKNTSSGNVISFGSELLLPQLGLDASFVACTDIDMDGKPDVICTAIYSNGVSIFRNTSSNGTISFAPMVIYPSGPNPIGITFTDMDMDGKPDLIMIGSPIFNSGKISILRNTSTPGNISFASLVQFETNVNPGQVAVGDIDGDGKNDLVITGGYLNTLSVFRNLSYPGTILLDNKKDIISTTLPSAVTIGDLNGDGKPDVINSLANDGKISIYTNTSVAGAISFAPRIDIAVGANPSSIEIADIDSDQKPDIIVANPASGSVSFIKNKINATLLTSFTPSSGVTGTVVTITGVNLTGVTGVSFGGVAASSFTVVNSTTITAIVAGGASGDVSVTAPAGILALSGFTFISPPTITSFTPVSASQGEIVTITGTNFIGVTAVSFGGIAATSFAVNSPTSIIAFVGAGSSGSVSVTAVGGTASLAGFTFNVITAINPVPANNFGIRLYPNPTNGSFTIDTLKLSDKWEVLEIFDVNGRKQMADINIKNKTKFTLHVDDFTSGIYTIILQRAKGQPAVIKFLKL